MCFVKDLDELLADDMSSFASFDRSINGRRTTHGRIINGNLAESYRRTDPVACAYCDACRWENAYNPVRQILRPLINEEVNCDRDTLQMIKSLLF